MDPPAILAGMSKLFREVGREPLFPAGSVVAIGAFDGVHRGHQRLLARARAQATAEGDLPSVALSFEPLPREFFNPDDAPARLTPARTKFERLRECGMSAIGLLRFDAAIAAMDAPEFAQRILVDALRAKVVCVGPDFRFGRARRGDIGMLSALGVEHGFRVQVLEEVCGDDGRRIGATAIRQALAVGAFIAAADALGRPYSISGRVVRGRQLGRTLGFPTANIPVRWRPAVQGIFAARVYGPNLDAWPAVASLGTRPTVGGGPAVLETHLFDFDGDLYGQRLEIEFVAHLRDELRFDSIDAMVAQMHLDAIAARTALAAESMPA
jgi:riboflavin kinase/FMN adenylyltransferase